MLCFGMFYLSGIGEDEAVSHRLYDLEVIEFSADVSFILVLPHAHNVCAVPGHTEETNPGCIVLPVQVFEMGMYYVAYLRQQSFASLF